MEIVENWLYVHCGIYRYLVMTVNSDIQKCSITAFIITLLLLSTFLLFHRAVVLSYYSIIRQAE